MSESRIVKVLSCRWLRYSLCYNTVMSCRRLAIAFVSGFSVMVFELIAARLMSPVVGTSTYVWTSIIGVIVAAMSLGYWAGGILADKRSRDSDVVCLLLFAALCMVCALYQQRSLLQWVASLEIDIRLQATIAACVLFAPSSFVLAALSPYLAKLQTESLTVAGRSVASLSAVNAVGSIVGTFSAGFFLFGWLGVQSVFVLLIAILVATSWLDNPGWRWRWRIGVSILFLVLIIIYIATPTPRKVSTQAVDTASAHYTIQQWVKDGKEIRGIMSGPAGVQSGVDIHQPDRLVFWYTQQLANAVERAPHKRRILMLGGGTFTLPQYLARRYPQSHIDVVEIDPGLLPIARQYFFYRDPPNVRPIFQDARVFLEQTNDRYDVVLVDVYNDGDIPSSLVTNEYAQALQRHLYDHSRIAVNMIASLQPECRPLLAAQDAPYSSIRGQGVFSLHQRYEQNNIIAIYGGNNEHKRPELFSGQTPYSDDFVPLERLRQTCQAQNK